MSEEGARRIMLERRRQIQQEGWSQEHDDTLVNGELAWAAVCYAAPERIYTLNQGITPKDPVISFQDPWPDNLDPAFDKRPSYKRTPALRTRIRSLEKAGALIAAEIDRLKRLREAEQSDEAPRVP
jgi:hypothetical protein